MLDDSGLRQLIEDVPKELETGLEEERSEDVVGRVSIGHFTETVTLMDNVMDLESGNRTSTPSKGVVCASGKQKAKGYETEAECVSRPKIVAFEIGDGSNEEGMAF